MITSKQYTEQSTTYAIKATHPGDTTQSIPVSKVKLIISIFIEIVSQIYWLNPIVVLRMMLVIDYIS